MRSNYQHHRDVRDTSQLEADSVPCRAAEATTSYQAEWGYSTAELALCQDVIALSGQALTQESGNPVRSRVGSVRASLEHQAPVLGLH